jgi:hypothetical protein
MLRDTGEKKTLAFTETVLHNEHLEQLADAQG